MLSDSDTDILSDIYSKIVSDILSGRGGAQRASDPVGPREMARSLYKVAVHKKAGKQENRLPMLARKLASEGVSVVYAVLCCVVCVCAGNSVKI